MFQLTDDQRAIVDGVTALCRKFDYDYWRACDDEARFPVEFHRMMADEGWLGATMPEEHGGAGLGIKEAALIMHTIATMGGGMTATSAVHMNMFGPHPIVVHGTPEQRARWLPRIISGQDQVAFGVTEPDAGLDTTSITTFATKVEGGYRVSGRKMWISTAQVAHKILLLTRTAPKPEKGQGKSTSGMSLFYTDLNRNNIEVRRIPKHGRAAVDSNALFIDDLFIPDGDLIGEEGRGFHYLLDGINPERVLIAVEAIGIGQDALHRAARYANERVVFGRPIGQNQGIQHPLAENWIMLEAALLMAERAADLYDTGRPCAAEANSAKLLGSRAGYQACQQAVLTLGGMGYAKEYHIERLLREVLVTRIGPITDQMILNFIAERVLELPKSY